MSNPVIILGAGGHAKVLIDALLLQQISIIGVTDPEVGLHGSDILGVPVIGNDDVIFQYSPDQVKLVNGLGSVRLPIQRQKLFEKFKHCGYSFFLVVHPSAIIARDVLLEEGVQILAGVILQTGARIGANTIVNTKATIDHDCCIGAHVHIAPGVTMSGGVSVGEGTHIGTGAIIIQNIRVGINSIIGAGAILRKDIPDNVISYGSSKISKDDF